MKQPKPRWFRLLQAASFLPVLLWPFFFTGSFFLFDSGESQTRYIIFALMIGYPVLIVLNALISGKLFHTHKRVSVALLLWPLAFFLASFILLIV
jgi:hypothetical protein